jgi:Uma2 family endonuclease
MTSAARRRYTIADYRATRDGPPWIQLVDGTLVMDPSPTRTHQESSLKVTLLLAPFVRARRLGKVYFAPLDVYLSDHNVFQPDVIFVSNERAMIIAEDGIYGAPDLVIEILSPSSLRRDRVQKQRVYQATGVKEFWIIDPGAASIQIFNFLPDAAVAVCTLSGRDSYLTPLFPGLKINTSKLFGC